MRTSFILLLICFSLSNIIACKKETNSACELSSANITSSSSRTEDQQLLASIYENLAQEAQTNSCTGSEQWGVTPVGAKPCGGPAAYMAYKKGIDTSCFFQKVEQYTLLSEQFNKKYQLISDCAVMSFPVKVNCVNGMVVLVY